MTRRISIDRALPWALRAAWVGVLVAGGGAVDEAIGDRLGRSPDVVVATGFGVWLVGVLAMAVPSVVGLTATRLVVPLAVPAATVALLAGATGASGVVFVALAVIASLIAFSADLGRTFVQASAYGEEDRHLLRPPAAYSLAAMLTWLVWSGTVVGAPLALADGRWVVGGILLAGAAGGAALGWPRWHRLSRRWFVVVPIGVVVHDHLVLSETVLIRRPELATMRLAPAATEAADLTGPAGGHTIEISTREPTTVILAGTPKKPGGTAIHLTSCLIAPTRPGAALRAAAGRGLPVG